MQSPIELHLVGDVRQALLRTNAHDPKNKQYKGIRIKAWFDMQASAGLLEIGHASTTWRSNQLIADFADSIFDASWGFEKTISENSSVTDHDGMFVVLPEHVATYMERFDPLCLRHSVSSAASLDLPFSNIGVAKGRSADRVLIAPTKPMVDFLCKRKPLGDLAACSLYVAVTRARASAAFVSDLGGKLGLPVWTP